MKTNTDADNAFMMSLKRHVLIDEDNGNSFIIASTRTLKEGWKKEDILNADISPVKIKSKLNYFKAQQTILLSVSKKYAEMFLHLDGNHARAFIYLRQYFQEEAIKKLFTFAWEAFNEVTQRKAATRAEHLRNRADKEARKMAAEATSIGSVSKAASIYGTL